MTITGKLVAGLIIGSLLGGAMYVGWNHYIGLHERINTLMEREGSLETVLTSKQGTITQLTGRVGQWEDAYKKQTRANVKLAADNRAAMTEVDRLNETLAEHDFEVLARRKPGLVENAVNDGTARALRLLQCATDRAGPGCGRDKRPADKPADPVGPAAEAPASGMDGDHARPPAGG